MTRCMSRLVMRADVDDDEIVGSDLHDDHNPACKGTRELFRYAQDAVFESSDSLLPSLRLIVESCRIVI